MSRYVFVLGYAKELCLAELTAVLTPFSPRIEILSSGLILAETQKPLEAASLQNTLGGTVKIGELISETPNLSAEVFFVLLRNFQASGKRITFGLSFYSPPSVDPHRLAQEIKDELASKHIPCRYILAKQGNELSSVVVFKNQLLEFLLIFKKDVGWMIAKTISVQDPDNWNSRDYGRPHASPKSGMLPPKVARMMVNIAMSNISAKGGQKSKNKFTLLDPFCGMGTILAEAVLLGIKVIGSDKSKEVAAKAQKNLEWLTRMYQLGKEAKFQVLISDAGHIAEKFDKNSVDIIVTEPFMGRVYSKKETSLIQKGRPIGVLEIRNTLKGLEKLYKGAFKNWRGILRRDGIVTMAFPEIDFGGQKYSVKSLVDTCENLGYTRVQGPLDYGRPQAVVRRKIYVFKKLT